MREVSSRNVVGQSVLWAFWLVLALAASGCGESWENSPTQPRRADATQALAVATAIPVIDSVAGEVAGRPLSANQFIRIKGRNFGVVQFDSSEVLFLLNSGRTKLSAGTVAAPTDWTSDSIRVLLLSSLTEAQSIGVQVQLRGGRAAGGVESNISSIDILPASVPTIDTISPVGAVQGQPVTITGANFGDAQASSSVLFTRANGTLISAGTAPVWSNEKIVVLLPAGVQSGPVVVAIGNLRSNPASNPEKNQIIVRDTEPPKLESSVPSSKTSQVDPRTSFTLVFSEPMGPGTTFPKNYVLTSLSGISRDISPSSIRFITPNTVQLQPSKPMVGNSTWTLSITEGKEPRPVADIAGNRLAGLDLRISTADLQGVPDADLTVPTLSTNPTPGETQVDRLTPIVLTFSEPVTFTGTPVTISGDNNSAPAAGPITPSADERIFTATPALEGGVTYSVAVSNFRDRAGLAFPGASFQFSTKEVPGQPGDRTPPELLTNFSTPKDGDRNVNVNSSVVLQFSEVMDPVALTTTSFYSLTQGTTDVPLRLTASSPSRVELAAATPPLDGERDYVLRLGSSLKDKRSNSLANTVIGFRTAAVSPGQPGDKNKPSLLSSEPLRGATLVDPSTKVRLLFSEPLGVAAAQTKANYTLTPGSVTNPLTATADGNLVTLDFGRLRVNTSYSLSLSSSLLVDGNGNALQTTGPITFTTLDIPGEPGDTRQPEVVEGSVFPTRNSTVGVDSAIFLTFTEAVSKATLDASLNTANFRLTADGSATPIRFDVLAITPTTLEISPTTTPLLSDTKYALIMSGGITDPQGNALKPFTLTFQTANVTGVAGADKTPPVLVGSTPPRGATDIDPFTNIVLVFSENMSPTSPGVTPTAAEITANYQLRAEGSATNVEFERPTVFKNFVSLTPKANSPTEPPLLVDTTYALVFPRDNTITDSAGNALAPTAPIFFRTRLIQGFAGERVPPAVVSVNPSEGTSVSTNSDIFVTFTELMDDRTFGVREPSPVTGSLRNVLITTSGGPYPVVTASGFAGNKSIMKVEAGFTDRGKTTKLLPGTKYTLFVGSGLTDKVGNPLVPKSGNFTTIDPPPPGGGRDVVSPVLRTSNPSDGAVDVDPDTKILLTFSEPLTSTAVSRANFTLTSPTGSFPPSTDAEPTESPPNSLIVTPGGLFGDTDYILVLSSAIKDIAGNALEPTAIRFKTAKVVGTSRDTTPPEVKETNPAHLSQAVLKDAQITVTFSKLVNFNTAVFDPDNPTSVTSTRALTSALHPGNYELFSSLDNPGIATATLLPFPPNSVLLSPGATLRGNTAYSFIPSTRIQDTAGNSLKVTRVAVQFQTADQPGTGPGDRTQPELTATNPPNNSVIINPLTNIIFSFSEPMSDDSSSDLTSVINKDNYFVATGCDLTSLASNPSPLTLSFVEALTVPANSYRLRFSPTEPDRLTPVNRLYLIELSNRISDRSGNPIKPAQTSFTLGAPPSPPAITFTSVDTSPVATDTRLITVQFDGDVVDTNDVGASTLTNNFIVTGIAKDGADPTFKFASDFAIAIDGTNTTESSPGTFTLALKRLGNADGDSDFRLKKGGSFSLTVVGFSGADSCRQAMSFFKRDFVATGQ
ncbi:MAG: Ig-like domain-containing protein [Candidatus Wallbacteria bacterium]|nr:Ig-like domain-containing protein [Candidatus Wallbacteria bacterium]